VGLVDAIRRWRLARQGLSSGKKRRIHSENPFVQALEESIWIKYSLYAAFAVASGVLILQASAGTSFAEDPLKGSLYAFIIALTAVVIFHISLQTACRRNSRVILVLGGVIGHLVMLRMVMGLADSGALPEAFRFFAVPFALAPMLHGVLIGRAVASFSAVYVTLLGGLLVPQADVLSYMILSIVGGMTSVMLAHQVRKRLQLLQSGIYVGAVTLAIGILLGRLNIASIFGPDAVIHLQSLGTGSAVALGTAVLTALLISGLLPLFEGMFHLTTDISWLELSDLNHPLLRQMQLEAPGTFHHSLVVAALSEAAA
jgi:membrane-associated HD superfamily phosphohydrolase